MVVVLGRLQERVDVGPAGEMVVALGRGQRERAVKLAGPGEAVRAPSRVLGRVGVE